MPVLFRFVLALLAGVGAASSPAGMPGQARAAAPDSSGVVRVMAYNIRHGQGADGTVDLERIARVVRDQQPDLVALQEVDRHTRRSGQDQVARLAELTGMRAVFGFAMRYQGGDFGNAVLSRLPVEAVRTVPLPGVPGRHEPRSALAVDVRTPDADFTFIAVHLDIHAPSRLAALPLIERLVAARPERSYVLAGDVNATPEEPAMRRLSEGWFNPTAGRSLPTYPASDPDRQIDYVLVRPAGRWEVVDVRVVPEAGASDHLPVVADLRLRASGE